MARKKSADSGVELHYVGDGTSYVMGLPTEGTITVNDEAEAADLVDTGLYARGPAAETGESEPQKEGSEA